MCKLIYSMTVSLDGYMSGPQGEIDWSEPDEELHRFHRLSSAEAWRFTVGRKPIPVVAGHFLVGTVLLLGVLPWGSTVVHRGRGRRKWDGDQKWLPRGYLRMCAGYCWRGRRDETPLSRLTSVEIAGLAG